MKKEFCVKLVIYKDWIFSWCQYFARDVFCQVKEVQM
jgi:hypothetical protein